jgi:hypothetical protein
MTANREGIAMTHARKGNAAGVPTPTSVERVRPGPDESPLQVAFTDLGLDRVVRGARALYAGESSWNGCFLAMAYGERGELVRQSHEAAPARVRTAKERAANRLFSKTVDTKVYADDVILDWWTTERRVSTLLGISIDHVQTIVESFDSDRHGFTTELTQWLESRGVDSASVLATARHDAGSKPLRTTAKQLGSYGDVWLGQLGTIEFHIVPRPVGERLRKQALAEKFTMAIRDELVLRTSGEVALPHP